MDCWLLSACRSLQITSVSTYQPSINSPKFALFASPLVVKCPNVASSIVFQSMGPTHGLLPEGNTEKLQDVEEGEENDEDLEVITAACIFGATTTVLKSYA